MTRLGERNKGNTGASPVVVDDIRSAKCCARARNTTRGARVLLPEKIIAGFMASVTDSISGQTEYAHDWLGNVTRVQFSNGTFTFRRAPVSACRLRDYIAGARIMHGFGKTVGLRNLTREVMQFRRAGWRGIGSA